MQGLLTWIFGYKLPSNDNATAQQGALVDKREKIVPIPVTRDITQTKEFWDRAVPS